MNYFCNTQGLCVESLRATPEIVWTGLLDCSPSAISDVENRIFGNAYRNNADGVDASGGTTAFTWRFDSGTSAVISCLQYTNVDIPGNVRDLSTGASTLLYRDFLLFITQSGLRRYTGRAYHALAIHSSIAFATDKTVPIDEAGNTGVFRCIGLATITGTRTALRKA